MNNVPMVDAASGRSASRGGFRGCVAFAVHAVACVALLFAVPLSPAQAQSTWKQSVTSGLWQTSSNWDGGIPSGTAAVAVFTGTGTNVNLTVTGPLPKSLPYDQPALGQLSFYNPGTTTISGSYGSQIGLGLWSSGTAIYLSSTTGNVIISNTNTGTYDTILGAYSTLVRTNQVWRNDSTSGTLSVQTNYGGITLGNSPASVFLTLAGVGTFRLGAIAGNPTGSGVTINGDGQGNGLVIFEGNNRYLGLTTVSSGTLQIGNNGTTGAVSDSGTIANNATLVFNRSNALTYGGVISGTGNVMKSGGDVLILTGNNTNTGLTTVSSGTLQIGNGSTVGSVAGNIANNATLVFSRSNAQTYSGTISGTGNLTKLQTNTLTLDRANTFSGTTNVTGQISLVNVSALQNSGIDTAGAGTITAPSTQSSLTIGGLIGSKNFSSVFTTNLNVTGLTLNPQDGRSYTYSGTIANGSATRTLTKTGAGEQILTAVNTYTGLTTVSAGRLTIGGGDINASSGVTVSGSGAEFRYNSATALGKPLTLTQGTLSGTGTIGTAVTVGSNAIISPGNSPGSQTYDSSTWQTGGTYLWEVKNLTGTPGTDWDRVVVTNALNLTALSGSSFNINLTTLTGSDTKGPLASAYVSGSTYIFPFVSFGSLTVPAGFTSGSNSDLTALFNFNLTDWVGISGSTKPLPKDISVKVNAAGNGLNLVIVPEPATIALAGIGIGSAIWFFRRRRTA